MRQEAGETREKKSFIKWLKRKRILIIIVLLVVGLFGAYFSYGIWAMLVRDVCTQLNWTPYNEANYPSYLECVANPPITKHFMMFLSSFIEWVTVFIPAFISRIVCMLFEGECGYGDYYPYYPSLIK